MSTKKNPRNELKDKATIWMHPEVKASLSTMKVRFRLSSRLTHQGHKMTEEAIFGALCLWAAAQDVEEMEFILEPYARRLDDLTYAAKARAHKKAPGLPAGEVEGVEETIIENGTKVDAARKGSGPRTQGGGKAV